MNWKMLFRMPMLQSRRQLCLRWRTRSKQVVNHSWRRLRGRWTLCGLPTRHWRVQLRALQGWLLQAEWNVALSVGKSIGCTFLGDKTISGTTRAVPVIATLSVPSLMFASRTTRALTTVCSLGRVYANPASEDAVIRFWIYENNKLSCKNEDF